MKSGVGERSCDVLKWLRETDRVKWTREVQDRINDEIADMSDDGVRERFSRRPMDRALARLFDRRRVPRRAGGLSSA